MAEFIHLKVRSQWSVSGASSPVALVRRALSQEHKTLALTDDMTLAGWPEFWRTCQETGIRPITGCTVFHSPVTSESTSRQAYPVTLLVENQSGYLHLLDMLHRLRVDSLPWRLTKSTPLLSLRDLLQGVEGLIVMIGGPGSELGEAVAEGNARAASLYLDAICDLCPRQQIVIEIVRLGLDQENASEPGLLELAQRWELMAVATNDVSCAAPAQFPAHCILNRSISPRTYDGSPLIPDWPAAGVPHLAPASEMLRKFSDARKLCQNAADLAERCAYHPGLDHPQAAADTSAAESPGVSIQFPKLDYPRGQSEESYVWNAIFTRAREQHAQIAGELKERLNREFEALKNAGCLPYLAFLARMIEALPRHMCYRFRRPGFTSSQVAYYLGLNYLSPHDLKIVFSLEDAVSGLGGPIQMEIPSGSEADFRKALAGLISAERMASPIVVNAAPASEIALLLCKALDLSGKQAKAATEFITELQDETAAQFFGEDLPEPALEDIVHNPASPNSLARLFFDLRDAWLVAAADTQRLIFSNTKLIRQTPLFVSGDGLSLQWPLDALDGLRFPLIEFFPRPELRLATNTLKSIHDEGISGAPRDFGATPVEHKSVLQLLEAVDTALIPELSGIEARVGLKRLAPDSFSALTKLQTPALARLPFFDRVAELALACKMAYLQMNYLQDYFLAYVEQRIGDPAAMRGMLRRLRREGIPVYGPRINISAPQPVLRDGGLQLAFSMLRGYTPQAWEQIMAARREMPFSGLVDFLQRVDLNLMSQEFIASLIQSGAFDIIERHRRRLWDQWQRISIWLTQTLGVRASANSLALDWDAVRALYADTAKKTESLPDWTIAERMDNERRACGFEISGAPIERYRDFLDQSNIFTGPVGKRLIRKALPFFWAGYAESWSVEHPQLEMLDNHALLDFGDFWGFMPLELFEEYKTWLTAHDAGVLYLTPSTIQGMTLFETQWAAPLDKCAWEAASRPSLHVDCAGWEGSQFRQMAKLCKLFPGSTRLEFQRVPARFVRKAARIQAKGIYYTPTFYQAIPAAPKT